MFNFLSDCCSKSYSIIAAVKLCVVTGNEVGSQNPDGTCRWRYIQAPEGDDADIPFDLWLLEPQRKVIFYRVKPLITNQIYSVGEVAYLALHSSNQSRTNQPHKAFNVQVQ